MRLLSLSDNALRLFSACDENSSPEEAFLSWALSLPDGVDPAQAAAGAIVRLDLARLRSAKGERLRELFTAAAGAAVPSGRVR